MTDKRKDEMPEQVFLYKNGEHFEALEFTHAPTHRDWTLYVRKDLSPPMPDDVAKRKCLGATCGYCGKEIRTALLEHEKMRGVLQGVRDALEQLMDDLSGGSMKYPNVGVCEAAWIQAEQQLASLDAVLERE